MEESVRSDISDSDFFVDPRYELGFGNHFSSEALSGALSQCQNNPLVCPYGLYAEQISGTAFTVPRKLNQRRYNADKSMDNCAFCNADGNFLIVPHKGRLWITTEYGRMQVSPGEIVVLPQGFCFSVYLPDGPSRDYIAEVFVTHFRLPDLGPIGANGLAASRDFLVPTAWFEQSLRPGYTIVQKFGG